MENDELYARAAFGKQVELFWSSAVGAYLRARAQEVYNAAIAELKSCDPTDTKKIVKLQSDIFKAEALETWLSEAILDGIKALDLIDSGEED